jgi:hypothetical protein
MKLHAGVVALLAVAGGGCGGVGTTPAPVPEPGVAIEDRHAAPPLGEPAVDPSPVPQGALTPPDHPSAGAATPGGPAAGGAALALLEQASGHAAAGRAETAAALLERAVRIEPANPWLWHRYAVLRLQQGNFEQAIALASKSNTLVRANERLAAGNWQVIARAKRVLGDVAGAERAAAQSRRHGWTGP